MLEFLLTQCAGLIRNGLGELQVRQPLLLTQKRSQRMTTELPEPSITQVPAAERPNALGLEPPHELPDHRLVAPPLLRQVPRPVRRSPLLLRRHQPCAGFGQLRKQARAPVVAIRQTKVLRLAGQRRGHREVTHVGRRQFALYDDARPDHPQMAAQAIEGLFGHLVVAIGGLLGQNPAAIGSGESTNGHWKAVYDPQGRITGYAAQQPLIQALFDSPKVGGLSGEGRAMHLQEFRKKAT